MGLSVNVMGPLLVRQPISEKMLFSMQVSDEGANHWQTIISARIRASSEVRAETVILVEESCSSAGRCQH